MLAQIQALMCMRLDACCREIEPRGSFSCLRLWQDMCYVEEFSHDGKTGVKGRREQPVALEATKVPRPNPEFKSDPNPQATTNTVSIHTNTPRLRFRYLY